MRKFTRRDFLRLSAAGATGAVVAACMPATPQIIKETVVVEKEVIKEVPAEPAAPVEVTYWQSWGGEFAKMVDRIARRFEEDNPDVKIRALRVEDSEMYPKLMTTVAAGEPPDTMMCWNESGALYTLAAEELITPIEDIADPDDFAKLKEEVSPYAWQIGMYAGKVWALPQWLQSYAIYCNVELLEEAGVDPDEPPETLEEFDAIAEKLYKWDDRGNIQVLGFDPGDWMFPWMGVFHGQYVDENGVPTANYENNVKALEWMCSYSERYDPKKIADFRATEAQGMGAQDPFLIGKYAMRETGPWHIGTIYEFKRDMNYTVWPLPRPEWLEGHGMASGGDIPVIPRGAKNPEASWKWVHYLTGVANPEAYASLWITGLRPHMPCSEKVARGPAFEKVREMYPGFQLFIDTFYGADWLVPPAKTPIATFYDARRNAWGEKARLLDMPAKEALDGLQKEVMDEYDKWMAAHE